MLLTMLLNALCYLFHLSVFYIFRSRDSDYLKPIVHGRKSCCFNKRQKNLQQSNVRRGPPSISDLNIPVDENVRSIMTTVDSPTTCVMILDRTEQCAPPTYANFPIETEAGGMMYSEIMECVQSYPGLSHPDDYVILGSFQNNRPHFYNHQPSRSQDYEAVA